MSKRTELNIFDKHRARKIFKKADTLLDKTGGEYMSLLGIDSPLFDGFETLDITREKIRAGEYIGRKITIRKDGKLVLSVSKNITFDVDFYDPGNWEKVLDDKDFSE